MAEARKAEIRPERVLEVVAAVAREARPNVALDAAQVTLDASLEKELGLDSLARVELVLRLEKEFGASLPEQALATSETPRDLLRFLLSSAGHAPRAADRASRAWCRPRACARPRSRRRARLTRRSNTTSSASPTG